MAVLQIGGEVASPPATADGHVIGDLLVDRVEMGNGSLLGGGGRPLAMPAATTLPDARNGPGAELVGWIVDQAEAGMVSAGPVGSAMQTDGVGFHRDPPQGNGETHLVQDDGKGEAGIVHGVTGNGPPGAFGTAPGFACLHAADHSRAEGTDGVGQRRVGTDGAVGTTDLARTDGPPVCMSGHFCSPLSGWYLTEVEGLAAHLASPWWSDRPTPSG
jgi:hypothetical protein